MNKIIVKNDLIESTTDGYIIINSSNDLVKKYEIIVNRSCELEVHYEGESKLSIEYVINKNVKVSIYEFRVSTKTKVKYKYDLDENAFLYLYRLNKVEDMNESDVVCLNGNNSKVDFNLRALSLKRDVYDILINHNSKNTKSIVDNIGVSSNGSVTFNVTGCVPKGFSNSVLDQNNQIVALNSTKCKVNPILLIDEFDVLASHNAVIGKFDDNALFYLMSRGIPETSAMKLLSEGLILKNLQKEKYKKEIKNIIDEYWG